MNDYNIPEIEEAHELKLDFDNLEFEEIQSIEVKQYNGPVHDLEVDTLHNYQVANLGIAHNGGGKRKGSFAIYLEPWHADIDAWLDLKKPTGKDEVRARDLFYALWVPDLFMERVQANETWSLMCPHEAPGLWDVHGQEFNELYLKYEAEGKYKEQVNARDLWIKILQLQIETGSPYILYKDAANRKSNQQNLGTIRSSNLCSEIIEYSSSDEIAVCNLASLALPSFVEEKGVFNFEKLYEVAYQTTINLNKVIDRNFYPVEEAERSNMRHRPIGLGVQGLADVYMAMRFAFDSKEAAKVNKKIFETIYLAAISASMDVAKEEGTYETFEGSPFSKGLLQFDLWNLETAEKITELGFEQLGQMLQHHVENHDLAGLEGVKKEIIETLEAEYESTGSKSSKWALERAHKIVVVEQVDKWNAVKEQIQKTGIRNSLLTALMPTASSAQILGNTESFEPLTSNMYKRTVLSGEFQIVNKFLIRHLDELGLWDDNMRQEIMYYGGSIQKIDRIPEEVRNIYKTVWEVEKKEVIDQAIDRGAFLDQTQSMNVYFDDAKFNDMNKMYFYAWRNGIKTNSYYFRTKPSTQAVKFTVNHKEQAIQEKAEEFCSLDNPDDCAACSA